MSDIAPIYLALAERLRARIAKGTLRPGERVPSVRAMSRQARVSAGTVVQAYEHLAARGEIEARPRSGYYVSAARLDEVSPRRRASLQPRTPPVALLDRVLALSATPDLLPLHAATPAPALLPTRKLAAITRDILRRIPERVHAYHHAPGLPELRAQIARRLAGRGLDVGADDITITAGTLEAITLSLQVLTRPGDAILVESPTYHSLMQTIEARGLKIVEVRSLGARGLDLEQAFEALATQPIRAALLIPSFANPTGASLDDDARRELARACARHRVPVIEDDIYAELAFDGQRPTPLKAFARDPDDVILCGSVSKMLSPGLRIGWTVNARWREALIRAKTFTSSAPPALSQHVVAAMYRGTELDRSLRRLRATLATNMGRFRQAIAMHWPAGTRVSQPRGGLVLWIQLPEGHDADVLFERARERGIGLLPGSLFSAQGGFRAHLRLSFGVEWNARCERALIDLGRLARP